MDAEGEAAQLPFYQWSASLTGCNGRLEYIAIAATKRKRGTVFQVYLLCAIDRPYLSHLVQIDHVASVAACEKSASEIFFDVRECISDQMLPLASMYFHIVS